MTNYKVTIVVTNTDREDDKDDAWYIAYTRDAESVSEAITDVAHAIDDSLPDRSSVSFEKKVSPSQL